MASDYSSLPVKIDSINPQWVEKRRRIEGGEILLPEVLIQQIQSFMGGKQAARTSILSKTWYSAWTTRPNLIFDRHFFGDNYWCYQEDERFWEFTKKTIQRFEALNLKIESFRLSLIGYLKSSNCHFAKELIVKAMKMGAVDFDLEHTNCKPTFLLPSEVLGSDTLVTLSVSGCGINLRKISCRKLKSLSLNRIWVEDDDIISNLISSCPLIEKLSLGSSYTAKKLDPDGVYGFGALSLYKLYNLKSLILSYVEVDNSFFSKLSANFPCLKDLSLDHCGGCNYKGIRISSRSLECITFKQDIVLKATFDVPSIRKFRWYSPCLPEVLFKTASREWKSDISLSCGRSFSTAWLHKLNKLLKSLRSSKISLFLNISSIAGECVVFRGLGLPKTAVDNLTINAPPCLLFTVLECLFWSCRPKFVTLQLSCQPTILLKIDFLEILRKRNIDEIREYCLTKFNELEEVDVQLIELTESPFEKPLPKEIHFQLRWRRQQGLV